MFNFRSVKLIKVLDIKKQQAGSRIHSSGNQRETWAGDISFQVPFVWEITSVISMYGII